MSECSVIIVNYNSGKVVTDAVRSALESNAAEVIVVDNASTDDSIAQLDQSLGLSRRVVVIRNRENMGFAAGCNIGARASSFPALLFLNPDCRLLHGAMSELSRALDSATDIGVVGPLLQNPDGTEQRGGRRKIPNIWSGLIFSIGLAQLGRLSTRLSLDFNQNKEPLPKDDVDVEAISGGCMMMKRSVFEAVGGWDENYFLHVEDVDICVRVRLAGWRIVFSPRAIAVHISGVSSKNRPIFVERHKHLGMIRFYEKFQAPKHPLAVRLATKAGIWTRFYLVAVRTLLVRPFRRKS